MSEEKDFSKVKRYGWVSRTWYEETYECIGEDDSGDYVSFKDYKALLESKSPKRQASFDDLKKMINKKIKILKKSAYDIFEKKNTINYGWAVSTYENAVQLEQALFKIEELTEDNI